MKLALIGATGFTGRPILDEALSRGHAVTAIARDLTPLPAHERLVPLRGDVADMASLARLVQGHDVAISAFNPGKDPTGGGPASIIAAVRKAAVPRLLVVGGAGSLQLPSGDRVVDQPDFPSEWKAGALRTAEFLEQLRATPDLAWTFLSPAATLFPGERTSRFRLGADRLLTDAAGSSRISTADLAVAMINEMERPQHHRRRFTVAY
ncbi:NAD(P)-dependent oxidoreductase [Brevundimonas diminuta]|uniref:NAD(P)-dependent oxidoreductase n=1 Tax=Brevundimonas diminuta TaxID=293 RepID=UPI003208122F